MARFHFIHRFVPGQLELSARTLLLLHGTGGNEDDLLPLGHQLDPTASLLSLRGKVLENGMPRFFRRLGEGVFDEEDLIQRANELAEFVGAAAVQYQFDPKQVVAVGYSNGANIAAAVLLLRPKVFAGAVLFRAMLPLEPAILPKLAEVRVLLSSGREDPIVPVENISRLASMLRDAGADVSLRFEAAGHPLVRGDIQAAKDWLKGWPSERLDPPPER